MVKTDLFLISFPHSILIKQQISTWIAILETRTSLVALRYLNCVCGSVVRSLFAVRLFPLVEELGHYAIFFIDTREAK